jgi:hypothetical protein
MPAVAGDKIREANESAALVAATAAQMIVKQCVRKRKSVRETLRIG